MNKLTLLLLAVVLGFHGTAHGLAPERLRCENLTDPIGIDSTTPRLSWIVTSKRRGAVQARYRVQVASSQASLEAGGADLWDSGEVISDETIRIAYGGEPLHSGERCYWRVRVWDQNGESSGWSPTALWQIGLLTPEEWEGEWIGYDAARDRVMPPAPMESAHWIGFTDDTPGAVPKGFRLFVKKIDLPEGDTPIKAEVLAAADDKFHLAVNKKMIVHGEEGWARVKPVSIVETLQAGANELRISVENFDEGPSGLIARVRIELSSGKVITFSTDDSWLSGDALGQHWPTRDIQPGELRPCRVIAPYGSQPWGEMVVQDLFLPSVPRLRSDFHLERKPVSATLYVSAQGLCDAYLNGERVSEEWFTPGWSDYKKRIYYRAYDVTDRLQEGANAIGVELADGWFSGYIGWGRNRDHYGKKPRARLQLSLRFADGTVRTVATDPDWLASPGPTMEADFLMGEAYDARQREAWSKPGYDDSDWAPVDTGSVADWDYAIEPHPSQPVVAIEEFEPVSLKEPEPGVYVFDLGQYIAGVARLKIQGEPGQRIRIRFAERLKPDGTLYTVNLRGARAIDTFTCSGASETWTPRFTFHGFQYVEVTGLDERPTLDTITGVALSSDTPRAGSFDCSDPMLNRLAKNVYWTQVANFIDVPTDCPQRDERLGWTGDAQVYIATACLNNDVQAFFDKWLVDLADGQRADGQFPAVAPLIVAPDDGGPAWADAGVICPWTIYQYYGDLEVLRRQYPSMKRFIEFCRGRSRDGVVAPDDFHCFSDWLSVNANTPNEIIYTAYYAYSTRLLAKSAEVLGLGEEAEEYHELADRIAAAFRENYVSAEGIIRGDTQCCYVLALAYDLLDDSQRAIAAKRLVEDIESRGNHLSTGFVGTKDLMLALDKIGRNDVASRLIHQKTYPSWGFSISHGATSIWERWDGWTPDKGFQDPGMNSFAHYSFGAVYQWMVENIGGIRNAGGAYKDIEIRPSFDDQLTSARVAYDSHRGEILSHWRRIGSQLTLEVHIPANTKATLRLTGVAPGEVTEVAHPLVHSDGVSRVRAEGGDAVAELGSGRYTFEIDAP